MPLHQKENIFRVKDVPYLVTLLIGIISFQLNYIITDYLDSPIVEYNPILCSSETEGDTLICNFCYKVENISKNKLFDSIEFWFKYGYTFENRIRMEKPSKEVIHPSSFKNVDIDEFPGSKAIKFTIPNFQPGFRYHFNFTVVQVSSKPVYPFLYVDSAQAVSLQEASMFTWVLKHRFLFNTILVSIFILITIFYMIKISV